MVGDASALLSFSSDFSEASVDGRSCGAGVSFSGIGGPCSELLVDDGLGDEGVGGGRFELGGWEGVAG